MRSPNEKILYVLTGPTAVGKTELALRWAEENDAEIISCDSLLFYRGMDVGTAKPTPTERARVQHHLIDVCEVTERMDITRYVTAARHAADDIWRRGKRILVTGGSGFYLRSFFAPVADGVTISAEIRQEIAARLEQHGLAALVQELRALDPAGSATVDLANPRRVVRALERCRATGKSVLQLAQEFSQQPAPFCDWDVRLTRLDRTPSELEQRIDSRAQSMLREGLVDEVRRLLPAGLRENPSAAKAIGYRETIDLIDGRLAEAELLSAIVKNTRALVKKQRTWFRTQLPLHRDLDASAARVAELFPAP